MLQSYPVILTPDENGTVIAQFPDVPEALTVGVDNTYALQWALGERMGIDGRQVRRILDLDHNTSLSHLTLALKSLGKELVIDIREAA